MSVRSWLAKDLETIRRVKILICIEVQTDFKDSKRDELFDYLS